MNRSALQVARDAAYKLSIDPPASIYGAGADRTGQELGSVLNELQERIVRSHDWSLLKRRITYQGDGVTEAFNLPADFLRMPKEGQVWSSRWQRPLMGVTPEDQLRLDVRQYDLITTNWTILGGQMVFKPALVVGEDATWFYIAKVAVQRAGGALNGNFEGDEDVFRLDDRVLELMLIAEMRMRKGFDYEMDMVTAQAALAQAISDDRGARIISQHSRRNIRANIAYPWEIVP